MEWFIFALLSAVFAALVTIFGKIGLKEIDPTFASTIRAFIMFIFMSLVIIFTGKWKENLNKSNLFWIVLAGISGALSWVFYFIALKIGEASKVAPIDRTSLLFIIILSFFVLGEKITIKEVLGASLILLGTLVLVIK